MLNVKNISYKKNIGFWTGSLLFLWIVLFINLEPDKPAVTHTFAIALLMETWRITKVVPVVLFPLFGVMDDKAISSTYFNHVIFLFIGGFLVALSMQKWDLHKRIAIRILLLTGSSPARILLGFMLATSFLSMWISNTATTEMLLPVLAGLSISTGINSLLLILPATISASLAFMIPVAKPNSFCI